MIALDPNRTVDFWLEVDGPTPKATRPTFTARYLTAREWNKVKDLISQAAAVEDPAEGMAMLAEGLGVGLTAWRNIKARDGAALEFDPANLPDMLTNLELWELIGQMCRVVQAGETSVKKSVSPAPSDSAPSAPDAAQSVA